MLVPCRVTPVLEEWTPQRTATQDPLIPPSSSPHHISSDVPPVPAASTKLPRSSRRGEGVNLRDARRERVKVPRSHDSTGEESDDSQVTAGSMRVQELTTRTTSPKQKVCGLWYVLCVCCYILMSNGGQSARSWARTRCCSYHVHVTSFHLVECSMTHHTVDQIVKGSVYSVNNPCLLLI